MPWLDDPVAAAMLLPPLALPLFIFGSALLEYVFPPYPGDVCVLLGFFLAAQGAASPAWVLAAALAGSVAGAAIAYGLGRRYGLLLLRFVMRRRWRSLSRRKTREIFQRFGERALVVNRFLPVVRGAMLYGAGVFNLRFVPSLLYASVSNLLFMSFLMWLGLVTSGTWRDLVTSARQTHQVLGLAAVAALAAVTAATLVRLRLARAGIQATAGNSSPRSVRSWR